MNNVTVVSRVVLLLLEHEKNKSLLIVLFQSKTDRCQRTTRATIQRQECVQAGSGRSVQWRLWASARCDNFVQQSGLGSNKRP